MELFGETLTFAVGFFLLLALALALSFEFVNGFHDTANAVATVIYTNTLKPVYAVVWSGCWNLIGVLLSSGAVAYGIVALLPVELVLQAGSGAGFAMIFALLVSAIIWNVGTWYLGLPASSSHTLIGAIIGVGVANSMIAGNGWAAGVNWSKAQEVFMALILSPIIGFVALRRASPSPEIPHPPRRPLQVAGKRQGPSPLDSRPARADLHRRQLRARLE